MTISLRSSLGSNRTFATNRLFLEEMTLQILRRTMHHYQENEEKAQRDANITTFKKPIRSLGIAWWGVPHVHCPRKNCHWSWAHDRGHWTPIPPRHPSIHTLSPPRVRQVLRFLVVMFFLIFTIFIIFLAWLGVEMSVWVFFLVTGYIYLLIIFQLLVGKCIFPW